MGKYLFTMITCGLLGGIVLAGCAAGPSVAPDQYQLSLPQGQSTRNVESPATDARTLEVATIDAPPWLNTTRIYYQLQYAHQSKVAPYSRARWVDSPPVLLEGLLQDYLARTGSWKAVVGPGSETVSDLSLRLDLLQMQQVFSSPAQSHVSLRVQATLINNRSQQVLKQRLFDLKVTAATPDASGGVTAMDQATHKLLKSVSRWLNSTINSQRGPHPQATSDDRIGKPVRHAS
jgi:cholesterol transport system auxiliary component